ncbi:MAG: AraC family transcriptional regulator ligand-binding domain-containing protein [Nevskia sp.]|nr:AraC family transcriptional regulator ligand-binding domain-containing protein [Nevskia sp.]
MAQPLPPSDRSTPVVPVQFARLVLQLAAERGGSRAAMLDGVGIPDALIDDDGGRLSVEQHENLLRRGIDLSGGKGGLGYELGLRIGLTTHTMTGYALLSQVTLGDAIRLGVEFSQLVIPVYRGRLWEEDGYAVLDISMDMAVEDRLYRYAYDLALTCVWSGLQTLLGGAWPDVELWFNYPEPEYYPLYESRLPICRFDMGVNQICFPAAQLSRRIHTGTPVMAQVMNDKLERAREARRQQARSDIRSLVLKHLACGPDGYPSQEALGARLLMSTRTLRRKLQQAGTSFQALLNETRIRDSTQLLDLSQMSVEDIGLRMGFAEPSNFTHAFRLWTGMTPSEWRGRRKTTA